MPERLGVELAEEFVRKVEDRELDHMRASADHAEIAAKTCGCRTCKHVERVTRDIFDDELYRVYNPETFVDEEEARIAWHNSGFKELHDDLHNTFIGG